MNPISLAQACGAANGLAKNARRNYLLPPGLALKHQAEAKRRARALPGRLLRAVVLGVSLTCFLLTSAVLASMLGALLPGVLHAWR